MKPTRGKWLVGEYDENELAIVTGNHTIALLDQSYYDYDSILSASECQANANLIAQAPPMLRCLKALVKMIDNAPFELSREQEKYRVYAHKVIKKAEGK